MKMRTMKRSPAAAAAKLAALMLASFLTVQQQAHAFSPINPARTTARIPSSSSALFFKPSSSSDSSSSSAASPTKAAAASISSFGEFSAAAAVVSTSSREVVVASTIATLSRKTASSTISFLQQQKQQSVSTELPIYQLALAGSLTTALADFVMHPIDCLKTIQQSDLGMDWSILQTGRYIYETFGWAGFFHGFVTYAMADAVGGAIKFTVWELWKQHATHVPIAMPSLFSTSQTSSPQTTETTTTTMDLTWLGPAMAFLASSIIIVPGEFLKQQLQMAHYDSLMQALVSVYSTSGLAGFFAGYDGVLLRDIPYTMLELGMYEVFKNWIQTQQQQQQQRNNGDNVSGAAIFQENTDNQKDDDSVMNQVLAAAMTGAVVAIFTTPMDVIKTKLMVDSYLNYADCLTTTIQNHGLASLYSGGLARIAWIVPFTAIYLPTYDFLKRQLLQRHLASKQQQQQDETAAAGATFFATPPTRISATSPLETV